MQSVCFAKLIKAKFHTKLLWDTEAKGYSNCASYHTHVSFLYPRHMKFAEGVYNFRPFC